MIVKIGKYKNWWGPYQIFNLLTYIGFKKDFCDSLAEKCPDSIVNHLQWIHDKRKRKIKVKIDDFDVWNLDESLSYIIHPALKQLKIKKHGIPMVSSFNYDCSHYAQECFDFYKDKDEEGIVFKSAEKEWEDILDKMIWSFEQINKDWESQYTIVQPEIDFTKYPEDEGKLYIPLRWKIEGKIDYDGIASHSKKIQEGLDLFGKWYLNLWD